MAGTHDGHLAEALPVFVDQWWDEWRKKSPSLVPPPHVATIIQWLADRGLQFNPVTGEWHGRIRYED